MTDIDSSAQALVRCPRCSGLWDPEAFVSPTGRRTKNCRNCLDRAQRAHRNHRQRIGAEGVRADNLITKYGITPEEYDALRVRQAYRCAVCGIHENDIRKYPRGRPRLDGQPSADAVRLAVDHCHHSGRVRGLLGPGCNAALGHFNDSVPALLAAARYLEGGQEDPLPATTAPISKLTIISGDVTQRVHFRGAVAVRVDGHVVEIPEGQSKVVMSSPGDYEIVSA